MLCLCWYWQHLFVWQIAKQQDTSLTIEDSAELFKQSLLRLEREKTANKKTKTLGYTTFWKPA
jgi:hypothetical protein